MTGSLGTYIVFALGVLVGMILGNKDFRYKFFKGLRGFMGQLGQGARSYNRRYTGEPRSEPRGQAQPISNRPEVQHIYKRVHESKVCPTCNGSGMVYEKGSPLQEGSPGYKPKAITCPECNGEGRVWD